ncbi:lytic murein transglycosylase [Segnochrobactrum spirostomi]|uniref:Lytic murein transglycosylase n=1 Tax=Segnochrobactrum spirostomi TaxID=2608987 RepID=A0A6A7Y7J4_9HYPH|nr:lytic murein transglycosylase [Segnochrobactrum spirostomi]MQT13622.1 lytic murein transglycosylase [Segnochrobactrum spirostomi]
MTVTLGEPFAPTRRALIAGLAGAAALVAAPSVFAADAAFVAWIRQFAAVARANGIPATLYNQAFAGINTPDPDVLRLAAKQPEFTKLVGDYIEGAVTDARIATGRKMMAEYKNALARIYARFGVEPQIVVAIWGIETSYGAVLDNPKIVRSVVRSLATLAYAGGPRADYGRTQLIAALKILQHHDVAPRGLTGSWAGAMGHTQFIPTSFLKYAVDLDGDGKRDIWNSVPDALATTANLLAQNGWQRGETWGYEVVLPRGFNYAYADEKTKRPVGAWAQLGIRRSGGRAFPRPGDEAKLILPTGARGPAFLILGNFDVIKAYNNSTSYALAVGYLADRIVGVPPFQTPWPTDLRPLSTAEVTEMQERLTARGFPTGTTDGKLGPDTRAAVRAYQMSIGWPADGFPTDALLQSLRAPR